MCVAGGNWVCFAISAGRAVSFVEDWVRLVEFVEPGMSLSLSSAQIGTRDRYGQVDRSLYGTGRSMDAGPVANGGRGIGEDSFRGSGCLIRWAFLKC